MGSLSPFNTLQQKQLFSITLCKFPLTFNSNYLLTNVFTISTLKHGFHQDFPSLSTFKTTICYNNNAKASNVEDNKHSIGTLNSKTPRKNIRGYSPLRSKDERVGRKIGSSSPVDEKIGKKYTRAGYVRQDLGSLEEREMGRGASLSKSKEVKSKKADVRAVVDEKITIVSKKTEEFNRKMDRSTSDGQGVKGEKKRRWSKKGKEVTPESQLRAGLDMCSKRGDFSTAISLYESALREGVDLGQYHYTVLLYLCSSAAVGVLHPAKSGSGNRSLDHMGSISDGPIVNALESNKTEDMFSESSEDESDSVASSNSFLLNSSGGHGSNSNRLEGVNSHVSERLNGCLDHNVILDVSKEGPEGNMYDKSTGTNCQNTNGLVTFKSDEKDSAREIEGNGNTEDRKIEVSEDVKRYALTMGFEIYEKMCVEEIPLNEATLTAVARMAMSMGNGDMALDMVNKMKELGINPRLRSYGPALFTFCKSGDVENAFMVEEHMRENGVYPEEPELEALLRLSVEASRGDKVYYLLHELRKRVRQVSPSTADLIERWFRSKTASRVGKRKWDNKLITKAMDNGGGGWHGQGWLGKGKWNVTRAFIGTDGVCGNCGDKLVTIDLDPTETEDFARSVASIAAKRERHSSFQDFQKWLDYYGPFEAVVDAANVGLYNERNFSPSKVNAVVNGIRHKLPSKKWPLIILHNKRITGRRMDEPMNKALIEKWKDANALYPTPTGSNDDWYWLYAAIKFKCLLVTNDEMRDHIFQLLGNDFFPRWKERHQVHFSYDQFGAQIIMPPPCSVVIQESEKGHWHIPIFVDDRTTERTWLCMTRTNPESSGSPTKHKAK